MAAVALTPCIAKPSTDIVLTMNNRQVLHLHKEWFQIPAATQWQQMIENANIYPMFAPKKPCMYRVNRQYNFRYIILTCSVPITWCDHCLPCCMLSGNHHLLFKWLTLKYKACFHKKLQLTWQLTYYTHFAYNRLTATLWVIWPIEAWGPLHGFTLIPAWMNNHISSKVWDEKPPLSQTRMAAPFSLGNGFLFLGVQWKYIHNFLGYGLVPNRHDVRSMKFAWKVLLALNAIEHFIFKMVG